MSNDHENANSPAGERPSSARASAAPLDPHTLDAILQQTFDLERAEDRPPALVKFLEAHRGEPPESPLVSQLVAAALSDFWPGVMSVAHRDLVCERVAQRFIEDPTAIERMRRLLQADEGAR